MSVILAESVAITKSRLAKGFNGDNLNLNGKVISAAEADAGFKAAGSVKPPYIAVLASGNQKGFAAGAADAAGISPRPCFKQTSNWEMISVYSSVPSSPVVEILER